MNRNYGLNRKLTLLHTSRATTLLFTAHTATLPRAASNRSHSNSLESMHYRQLRLNSPLKIPCTILPYTVD